MANDWTQQEIDATVESYFDYIRAVEPPPKAHVYKDLHATKIPNRSVSAIEFKFQNISAVLNANGLPWTPGLAPLDNYQADLATDVTVYLEERRKDFLESFRALHPTTDDNFRGTWDKDGQQWAAKLYGIDVTASCFYGTDSDASKQLPRQMQQAGARGAAFLSLSYRSGSTDHDAAVTNLTEKTSLWPDSLDAVAISYLDAGQWRVGTLVARPESRFTVLTKLFLNPDAQYVTVDLPSLSPVATPQPTSTKSAQLDHPLNVILYGPPGTGKTYSTRERALAICGYDGLPPDEQRTRYDDLVQTGRIHFVTFHQSFAYEDFVEGIRPQVDAETDQIVYRPVDGVFKRVCQSASDRVPLESQHAKNVWKMSLNIAGSDWFDRCIEASEIRLGWGRDVDFQEARTRTDVEALYERKGLRKSKYGPLAVHYFRNEMEPGDIVIIADGTKKFRGVARITGDYDFDPDSKRGQRRAVDWLATFRPSRSVEEILNDREFARQTLYALDSKVISEQSGEAVPYVLIVDEINRANVSKVLGELITLLEPDKRIGAENEKRATLPYSRDGFGVPSNLFILGTMNTADRSLATLDIALRRRFEFIEVTPDLALVEDRVGEIDGVRPTELLRTINQRIEFLIDRDHRIGHAEFLDLATIDDVGQLFRSRVIPLLEEYFHGDLEKVALVLGCGTDEDGKTTNEHPIVLAQLASASKLFGTSADLDDRFTFEIDPEFVSASGQDLAPYLQGILKPRA